MRHKFVFSLHNKVVTLLSCSICVMHVFGSLAMYNTMESRVIARNRSTVVTLGYAKCNGYTRNSYGIVPDILSVL